MMRLAVTTALVIATLLGLWVLWELREAIVLFLLSLALTAALRPLVDFLTRGGLPRAVGVTGAYVLAGGLFVLLVLVVSGLLWGDLQRAGDDFRRLVEHVATVWPREGWIQRTLARHLPPAEEVVGALTGPQGAAALQTVLGTAFNLLWTVIDLLVIIVLSIYWMADRVHFERLWFSLLPLQARAAGRDLLRSLEREVGAYFRSAGVQSFLAAVFLGLSYWLVGFPYPTLLALVAALAWLVPWVGIPLAVLALAVLGMPALVLDGSDFGWIALAAAAVCTLAVLGLLARLVEPRWFDRQRYNSLLMALAIIAMAETFGILGLVLGPPLAVALQVIGEHLMQLRLAPAAEEEAPVLEDLEEQLAALRAQVAELRPPPPELATMVERLNRLVDEARGVLSDAVPG